MEALAIPQGRRCLEEVSRRAGDVLRSCPAGQEMS